MYMQSLLIALPELALAAGALLLLMVGTFSSTGRGEGSPRVIGIVSILILILVAILAYDRAEVQTAFNGAYIVDPFARFVKIAIYLSAAIALVMTMGVQRSDNGLNKYELAVLMLFAVLGMSMMVSANDLIALYVGLEMQSLSLYIIVGFKRESPRANEAALKYFVLGALSSGMLLYGASLIYGFTGSTNFPVIADYLASHEAGLGVIFGLVFLTAGLAFKISAVPFHMWTPDVYEGAPTPITAFLAGAPKMAAMAMFVRVVIQPLGGAFDEWQQILSFIAIASMVLGAVAAIGQRNIKRLMAYSSIGHMGFALVGLATGTVEGIRGVLIYMAIYLVMTLGTFACILAMRRKEGRVEAIDDLAGLGTTRPMMALALTCLMFSLAGIPIFAGFFAKFYVFTAAIKAELYTLAIIGVIASVVGAFYYLRIVKIMYFDDPAQGFEPVRKELGVVLTAAALVVTFFVFYPGPLLNGASVAAQTFFP